MLGYSLFFLCLTLLIITEIRNMRLRSKLVDIRMQRDMLFKAVEMYNSKPLAKESEK